MGTTLQFGQVVIDAARADELAGFYARLLDRPIGDGASSFYAVIPGSAGFPSLMFLAVPEARAGKNRLHLDFAAADHVAAADRAVELGATRVGDFDQYGIRWTTLADPEGNVFDIGQAHRD